MLDWQWAKEQIKGWPIDIDIPKGVRLNLGCGNVILPKEEGWINIDKANVEGVDRICDLFEFPWPFEDNSADYILASHIIEHVPHQVFDSEFSMPLAQKRGNILKLKAPLPLDGFLAFFAEVWRILKPSGLITVIAPYGFSTQAMQDPTHTRFIVPASFSYLAKVDDGPFDYQIPFKFKAIRGALVYASDELSIANLSAEERLYHLRRTFDVADAIRCDLEAVKPLDKP